MYCRIFFQSSLSISGAGILLIDGIWVIRLVRNSKVGISIFILNTAEFAAMDYTITV